VSALPLSDSYVDRSRPCRTTDCYNTPQGEYDPFGEYLPAAGPMAKTSPFRFSTEYQDDEPEAVNEVLANHHCCHAVVCSGEGSWTEIPPGKAIDREFQ